MGPPCIAVTLARATTNASCNWVRSVQFSSCAANKPLVYDRVGGGYRNVHRILVRGVNAPLPPEAKKIWKI